MVKYGEPFLLQVTESNLDGKLTSEDLGMLRDPAHEENFTLGDVKAEIQEYGGGAQVYLCIPLSRVWTDDGGDDNDSTDAPNRVVNVDRPTTVIEVMARVAAAVGEFVR